MCSRVYDYFASCDSKRLILQFKSDCGKTNIDKMVLSVLRCSVVVLRRQLVIFYYFTSFTASRRVAHYLKHTLANHTTMITSDRGIFMCHVWFVGYKSKMWRSIRGRSVAFIEMWKVQLRPQVNTTENSPRIHSKRCVSYLLYMQIKLLVLGLISTLGISQH